ncbi:MAG: hypothetical protein ACI8PF_000384 [Flavobacteriaceae bacterium]|jgi:hypothetical protein
MFQIKNTLVSESIIENDFVCNLSACKGACCVEGDAGAPLESHEVAKIKEVYPIIKQYLSDTSITEINQQGNFITTTAGDLETPLVNGKECVYLTFDQNKTALCSFEKAYKAGLISWRKPISCHLYPVRTKDFSEFISVNYDKWDICDDACILGKELKVPVYKFVKEALIRKFGKEWYSELELAAEDFKE